MIYATANGAYSPLTKCTKMLKEEENETKDVLNGNGDCAPPATATATPRAAPSDREDAPRGATYTQGGRLKFFKDGKFILELERSREGERVSWVSVPRKTFWPPQVTASSTPTYRQESSTSLSVSDDNSSIQSSPWQRDHSWKQATPRKNLSKQLTFYYIANRRLLRFKSKKTRKPLDTSPEDDVKPPRNASKPSGKSTQRTRKRKEKRLQSVLQVLADKVAAASPAREPIVSPRKRILREMDKDSKTHTDDTGLKRSRGKPTSAHVSCKVASPVRTNGVVVDEPVHHQATASRTHSRSSYSITSLLSDDKAVKRSPANSPSHFPPGGVVAAGQHPQPYAAKSTPEDRLYKESVDRLRSIELSHVVDKRLCLPYAMPPSFMPPFIHPYSLPPHYLHAFARGFPGLAAAPPTYPLPLPVRPDKPSCSWAAEPPRDTEHRDDNIADMPLNLSKHAGVKDEILRQ